MIELSVNGWITIYIHIYQNTKSSNEMNEWIKESELQYYMWLCMHV